VIDSDVTCDELMTMMTLPPAAAAVYVWLCLSMFVSVRLCVCMFM